MTDHFLDVNDVPSDRCLDVGWTSALLYAGLLFCLRSGVFGAIDRGNLKAVIDYLRGYSVECNHYAVAVRLNGQYCNAPTLSNLQTALRDKDMDQMHNAINQQNGIYVPEPTGNIVAARSNLNFKNYEHAEWRLLTGDQNSPVAKILKNKDQNSCLIFYSKFSPCKDWCLKQNDTRNFVQWLNPLFAKLNENSRAFVFETFYGNDSEKEPAIVVEAWKSTPNAPLFRCYNNNQDCIMCFINNQLNPKCLAK